MTAQLGLTLGLEPKRAGIDWSFQDAVHSVASSEWYSPPEILDAGREAVGGEFDLDPASSEAANKLVRAKTFYTLQTQIEAGRPWSGRMWINPPSPPRPWWDALVDAWKGLDDTNAHDPLAGIFPGYSIEVMQQSQGWRAPMMRFPFCVPKTRVRFWCTAADAADLLAKGLEKRLERSGAGATRAEFKRLEQLHAMDPRELVKGDAPTHASVIVGVGVDRELFSQAFRSIGEVCNGAR